MSKVRSILLERLRTVLILIGVGFPAFGIFVVAVHQTIGQSDRAAALQTLMTAFQMIGLLTLASEVQRRLAKNQYEFIIALVRWPQDVANIEEGQTSFRLDTGESTFVVALKNIGRERLENLRIVLSASAEDQQTFRLTTGRHSDHLHFVRGGASSTLELSERIRSLIPGELCWAWAGIQRNSQDRGTIAIRVEVAADNLPNIQTREFQVYLPPLQ